MSEVKVTYEGPTPSGGLSTAVRVQDKSGKRYTFHQGVEQTVDASVAKLAEAVQGHNFKVEPVGAKKGDS